MLKLIHISEGIRYFRKSLKRKISGPKKYKGNANQICKQIIEDCWNKQYFTVSAGHYKEFWSRDLGFTIGSLLKLGHRKRVLKTLEYALIIYEKNNKITTAINPKGIPFSFPNIYSPDSVALFFYSLKQAKADKLIKKYKVFLNKEIMKFYNKVLDKKTGLVKRNTTFSGARDHAIRDSSCYDNCMLALMAKTVKELKLKNPFKHNFKKIIKQNFWTGKYFKDDLSSNSITGDANIIPFWTKLFTEKEMLQKVIKTIQPLTKPFPLKYQTKGKKRMILTEILVPNWEYDSIWCQWGLLYLQITKNKILKNKYKEIIEKYKTGYEVFHPNGKPYKNFFYMSDEAMLWYANYLTTSF